MTDNDKPTQTPLAPSVRASGGGVNKKVSIEDDGHVSSDGQGSLNEDIALGGRPSKKWWKRNEVIIAAVIGAAGAIAAAVVALQK